MIPNDSRVADLAAAAAAVAGHARLLAARKLDLKEAPVIMLDHLTETQRRALVIAHNRLALNAGWDDEMLRVELEALRVDEFNLDLLGFNDAEIEALLAEPEVVGNADDDAVPEVLETPVTVSGDVWLLGEHRLLCGDSTQMEAVEKILAGALADLVWTDPPYNVNHGATMKDKLRGKKRAIKNDNLGRDFEQFLRDACTITLAVTKGVVYICMSSSELHTLQKTFREAGGHWSTFVIWAKNTFTMGRSDYQRQYEPFLHGWKEGTNHYWCAGRRLPVRAPPSKTMDEASTRSACSEEQWQREVDRCRAEIAQVERLLRGGHPDVAGLCLALHDWSQELRILHRERDEWMNGSSR